MCFLKGKGGEGFEFCFEANFNFRGWTLEAEEVEVEVEVEVRVKFVSGGDAVSITCKSSFLVQAFGIWGIFLGLGEVQLLEVRVEGEWNE